MLNRIGLNFDFILKYLPWYIDAATGKVDIILANFTATEERAEQVDFALPYMKVKLGVVSPDNALTTDNTEVLAWAIR